MTAKEFLSRAFTLEREIKAKQAQIQRLRDTQGNVSAVLSHAKVKGSGGYDRLGDITAEIIDLTNEYAADITKLLRIKHEIRTAIERVENPIYKLILEERYINFKRWEDIAADNDYCWQWVHKIHKKTLLAIESDYLDMV